MKAKTRKGVSKRVKTTGTGKRILGNACTRHLLSNKSSKAKNRNAYGLVAAKSDERKIAKMLPGS